MNIYFNFYMLIIWLRNAQFEPLSNRVWRWAESLVGLSWWWALLVRALNNQHAWRLFGARLAILRRISEL